MAPDVTRSRAAAGPGSPPELGDEGSISHYQTTEEETPSSSTMVSHAYRKSPQIQGQSLTLRGILVGLLVGLVICFSNMYFGLQTGWVSTMTMPASLMGFGFFKLLSRHLKFPFSPVENVLVQTAAGSMAIMPLGCGFVGVVSVSLLSTLLILPEARS